MENVMENVMDIPEICNDYIPALFVYCCDDKVYRNE
jgi:hypothetical protein